MRNRHAGSARFGALAGAAVLAGGLVSVLLAGGQAAHAATLAQPATAAQAATAKNACATRPAATTVASAHSWHATARHAAGISLLASQRSGHTASPSASRRTVSPNASASRSGSASPSGSASSAPSPDKSTPKPSRSATPTATPSNSHHPTPSTSPSKTKSPSSSTSPSPSKTSGSPSPSKTGPSPNQSTPVPTKTPTPKPSKTKSPSPSPSPKPRTSRLCVSVQPFTSKARVHPGGTATYVIWVWSTRASTENVTVQAATGQVNGVGAVRFSVCPSASGATCSLGSLPRGQADELQARVRVWQSANPGDHVTLTAKATAKGAVSFSAAGSFKIVSSHTPAPTTPPATTPATTPPATTPTLPPVPAIPPVPARPRA